MGAGMTEALGKESKGAGGWLYAAVAAVLLSGLFCLPGSLAAGEFFQWVDEKGVTHVADSFPTLSSTAGKRDVRRLNVPVQTSDPVPHPAGLPSDEFEIPFTSGPGGGMLVQGVFDDSLDVTLLLDTGATHVVIPEALARRLNPPSQAGRKVKVQTVGGVIEARTTTIAKVSVGDALREMVPVVVTDRESRDDGFDAILGMSFLQNFKMTVDHKNHMIVLKPHQR